MNIYDPYYHGEWIDDFKSSSFKDADIVVLPGGSDWNPALYGHTRLPSTFVHPASDAEEMGLIDKAVDAGKFLVGICKGAQGLTIKAGGWLIQHVNGHSGSHEIETFDGKTLKVTSTHHQMCYPYDLPDHKYELLGWARGLSSTYLTAPEANRDILDDVERYKIGKFVEPEVIWFPKIRGLSIQNHPEYGSSPKETNDWLNQQILRLI